ncbi:shikimate dehydrogenase [Actinomyces lilanjuaniae]|uniref:Shikimate dehydrogenase n=1 Tax=Actinomyces lilanjuaniae TaxID=2321394 RepID=A0ABM6Z358_9ACTO|nr:shikimate dehydrogenase [Actinomyces lilanjuaniae]
MAGRRPASPVRPVAGSGTGAAGEGSASRQGEVLGHRAAVVGHPVSHSLSPVLHRAAYAQLGLGTWHYTRIDLPVTRLPGLVSQLAAPVSDGWAWSGLSVTMPHKQALVPMLDVVDPLAQAVGSVNTVVAQRSGTGPALLAGFNTDVTGIVEAVRETAAAWSAQALPALPTCAPGRADGWGVSGATAVVLGSGATACSALAALTELGATRIVVAARRHAGPGRALSAAHRMGLEVEALTWTPGEVRSDSAVAEVLAQADLAVSTLPAGGADTLAEALPGVLGGRLTAGAVLLDVVYAPWPTPLASAWERGGGAVAPGWLMLLHQAVPQVRLMTGRGPDVAPMRDALLRAL